MEKKVRTSTKVDQFIMNLPNEIHNLTIALREIILNTSPNLVEEYKWSMPNYTYKGLVCYIQTAKHHVNLGFFKGDELLEKDHNNLLQGSAKKMRQIKIRKMEDIQPEVITSVIQAAIALNEK